jgi:hypothetical protein
MGVEPIPTFKKATILRAHSAVRCMPVLDGAALIAAVFGVI